MSDYKSSNLHPKVKSALSYTSFDLSAEIARYQETIKTPPTNFEVPSPPVPEAREQNLLDKIQSSLDAASNLSQEELKMNITPNPTPKNAQEISPNYNALLDDYWKYRKEENFAGHYNTLLTAIASPLGIGSIFMLVVVTGFLSSYLLNSPQLSHNTLPDDSPELYTNSTPETGIAQDLSTVTNFKNINTSVQSNPTAKTVRQENPSELAKALLPKDLTKETTTEPSITLNPSAVKVDKKLYYVLLSDVSGKQLQKAQSIISKAFVGKFPIGVRIQMAAYTTQKEAESLVKKLQKQGLKASVYSGKK